MKSDRLAFRPGFRVSIGNARSQAAVMVLPPGRREGGTDNRHARADQRLFVVDGTGVAVINGRKVELKPGRLLLIEAGDRHEVRNSGRSPLQTVSVYLPPDADARFFTEGLDSSALVVHGRHSHERQGPASDRRLRMIVSDRSPGFFVHPSISNAWVWNPASMAFEKACRGMGVTEGKVAVSGGTGVFGLFLKIGFDAFHLSRAAKLVLPGGRPVFPEVPAKTPEQVLSEHGLRPAPVQMLDREADVTLVSWKREGVHEESVR